MLPGMGVVLVGREGGVLVPFARACTELDLSFRWVEPASETWLGRGAEVVIVEVRRASDASRARSALADVSPPVPLVAVVSDPSLADALLELGVDDCAVSPVSHDGALVHLRLALAPPRMAVSDVVAPRPRLLVIDDEPLIGKSLVYMLSDWFEVESTTSARDGLSRIDAGVQVDVVLCDLTMPDMNGAEFHAELEKRDRRLAARVVFLSGGVFNQETEAFLGTVSNPMIEKPFEVDALRAAIAAVLVDAAEAKLASG